MINYWVYRDMQLIKLTASLLLLLILAPLQAAEIKGFKAKYVAYRHGKDLGEAKMQLRPLGNDMYQLLYESKVSLFFLSDERKESSLFKITDGNIQAYKYSYLRDGTGPAKALTAEFDASNKRITLGNGTTLPWQGEYDNQLYRLAVQLHLANEQQQLDYPIINYRGEKKTYQIELLARESVTLPFGKLDAIKIRIARKNKKNNKRETFAWFAPELNFQLVRLQQFKEGKEQGDIQLSHYKLDTY